MSSESASTSNFAGMDSMPTEVLLQILTNIDSAQLLNLRSSSRRFRNIIDRSFELNAKFNSKKIDRLLISFNEEQHAYILRAVCYETQSDIDFFITTDQVQENHCLKPILRSLNIRRIYFEDFQNDAFNDEFVDYIIGQLSLAKQFMPLAIGIHRCNMAALSADGMHRLIKGCGNQLTQFSLRDVFNARSDTFTDEHVNDLDVSQMALFEIHSISMRAECEYLSVTDHLFYELIRAHRFPTLQLQLCLVSTLGLASYTKEWIKEVEGFSHINCTFTDCPDISQKGFVNVCQKIEDAKLAACTDNFVSVYQEDNALSIFTVNFGRIHAPTAKAEHGFSLCKENHIENTNKE